ncbi:hypothetical protein CAP31_14630 (plasmid) [Sulfuriferula sp. AH1]|nr:hypothetical protein CAP31_14630 [Sulfuriferula sp. AH1]
MITNPGALTPVFSGVAKMNTNQELGVSIEQAETMANAFFEQIEPKVRKGRAWTFHRLNAACDTPNAERVQAVLYPDDGQGFALYARQGQTLHAVTHDGRPVRFRTFEKALTTLADVSHLDPEIIVDSSNWCEETGPH